jgi:arylsulfatase A-like enzyme
VVVPRSGGQPLSSSVALISLVGALVFLPGCAQRTADATRPSIVLAVLDTVRADRFAPDAPEAVRASTPALDRFTRTAVVYRQARSPAALTMPAMAALMTGHYPHTVGIVGHSRRDRLAPSAETLVGIANRAGYRTAAVVTNPWLALRASGFVRDFDTVVSGRTLGRGRTRMHAEEVVDQAERILATGDDRPTFLWVHFMDAHMPYTDGEVRTRITEAFTRSAAERSRIFFEAPYTTAEIAATRTAYNSAIARIDKAVGRLLDRLPSNAIVVVLADHGESLGEHGLYFAHDFTVYDELLRVPLMLRAPGVAPAEEWAAVSLIDVMPTICALAGLDCGKNLDGIRLPRTGGNEDPARFDERTIYAASSPARARYSCPWLSVPGPAGRLTMALVGRRKLIRLPTPSGTAYRAYDLREDPEEKVDRFAANLDRASAADLDAWSVSALPPETLSHGIPKAFARELRELGYLE